MILKISLFNYLLIHSTFTETNQHSVNHFSLTKFQTCSSLFLSADLPFLQCLFFRKFITTNSIVTPLRCTFFLFIFIYSHVHTLFGSLLSPIPSLSSCPHPTLPYPRLTTRQNLFCPYL
jgi:hypothetical protein